MTRSNIFILLIIFIISSCQTRNGSSSYDGKNSSATPELSILERPLPDSRGVITYKDYQILVANGSETVEGIANRLKIDPKRLASYNGVLLTYLPRKEEILALPVKVAGNLVSTPSGWSQEGAREAITGSLAKKQPIGTPDNPLRHRIEAGETAYSVARLYNVSVTSLAKWNGLDANLKLAIGRELIIPVSSLNNVDSSSSSVPKISGNEPKDNVTETDEPVPVEGKNPTTNNNTSTNDTEVTANKIADEESGNPSEIEITEKPYVKPVPGRILRGYNPTAVSNKNEGVDFYAPPGTLVKAAADGVVALISKPVGGLGKIVLIKHDQSVISIYGRIKDLQVLKGGRVVQGQEIGKVENSFLQNDNSGKDNYLHFELRKGTNSLDPVPLLQ